MSVINASKIVDFSVRDDVVHFGNDEDGCPIEGLAYYVVVEYADGTRFAHNHTFANRKYVESSDGEPGWFARLEGIEAKAEALMNKIRLHVQAGGSLDSAHWDEDRPAYGSEAYIQLDNLGYFRDLERNQEMEGR